MSQNFCQHENQKLLPLAKEFSVSYIIKNDHNNPNYNPYLHRFFCSKLQSYHSKYSMIIIFFFQKLESMKFVIWKLILDHVEHPCPDTFSIPNLENVNCLLMVAVQEIETILNQLLNVRKSVSQANCTIKKREKNKEFFLHCLGKKYGRALLFVVFTVIFPAKKRLLAC